MKISNPLEILSPAGDYESMVAAVSAGADAIYLGGKNFSARARSANFEQKELEKAIDYCHLRGVSVYCAINTLIKDSEMEDALKEVSRLYHLGIDALIVQDVGFIEQIRKSGMDIKLHFSTQSTVLTHLDVKALEDLDISRLVLAREMDVKDIKKFSKENKEISLEAFVHGAVCVCYSGKCLFSALKGGRSANRGGCAQVCRKEYLTTVKREKIPYGKYILSPKDLSTIEGLTDIIEAGVTSFKIEGRMKRPEYVYVTTYYYNLAIEEYLQTGTISQDLIEKAKEDMSKVFNREFTKGYILGDRGSEIMNTDFQKPLGKKAGTVIKNDKKAKRLHLDTYIDLRKGDGLSTGENIGRIITTKGKIQEKSKAKDRIILDYVGNMKAGDTVYLTKDHTFYQKINQGIAREKKKKLQAFVEIKIGEKARLTLYDQDSGISSSQTTKERVESAKNAPLTLDKIKENISKTGNTPFYLKFEEVSLDTGAFLSMSSLNSLKRKALSQMKEEIISSHKKPRIEVIPIPKESRKKDQSPNIYLYLRGLQNGGIETLTKYDLKNRKKINTSLVLDEVVDYGNYSENEKKAKESEGRYLTSSYAFVSKKSILSPHLNIYNSYGHSYYHKKEAYTMPSYESLALDLDSLSHISHKSMVVIPIISYPPLMISEYCPHKDKKGRCIYDYHCALPYTEIKNREGDVFHFKKFANCKTIITDERPFTLNQKDVDFLIDIGFRNFYIEYDKGSSKEEIVLEKAFDLLI